MSIELIGIIAVAVGLISIFRKPSFIIYVFVFSTLLGAAAGLILDSLGGASVSPAHLLLGFVVYRLMNDREIARGAIDFIKPGRPGFLARGHGRLRASNGVYLPATFCRGDICFSPASSKQVYRASTARHF